MSEAAMRRRWLLAWLGGPLIGIANGVARELGYKERVDDLLLRDDDVAGGHLWPLALVWLAAGPEVVRRRRRAGAHRFLARVDGAMR